MHHVDLATITLGSGAHASPDKGVCVMEAVAYFAGEPHSDHPVCASPVITAFAIRLNDRWDDATRQRLVPFIPRIAGTRDPALENVRRYLIVDWATRDFAPRWLRKAGLDEHAAALEGLPEITGRAGVKSAAKIVSAARDAAWTARDVSRGKIRAAVLAELEKRGIKPAVAAAVAAAVADADAVAVAVAVAAAVAAAAADTVAVAVAAAVAAAAADADADAVAVAAAVAAADAVAVAVAAAAPGWQVYDAAYAAAYKVVRPRFEEARADTIRETQDQALALLDRLIDVKAPVAA